MKPYFENGHNVTTDNFFTSLNLRENSIKKSTSLIGTLNQIRREVLQSAKIIGQLLYSTILFKKDNTTLTVHQGKVTKNVFLLSSLHLTVQIDTNEKLIPVIVQFYNETISTKLMLTKWHGFTQQNWKIEDSLRMFSLTYLILQKSMPVCCTKRPLAK